MRGNYRLDMGEAVLTYETELTLFVAVLENYVKPISRHFPPTQGLGFLGLQRRPMIDSIYVKHIIRQPCDCNGPCILICGNMESIIGVRCRPRNPNPRVNG